MQKWKYMFWSHWEYSPQPKHTATEIELLVIVLKSECGILKTELERVAAPAEFKSRLHVSVT